MGHFFELGTWKSSRAPFWKKLPGTDRTPLPSRCSCFRPWVGRYPVWSTITSVIVWSARSWGLLPESRRRQLARRKRIVSVALIPFLTVLSVRTLPTCTLCSWLNGNCRSPDRPYFLSCKNHFARASKGERVLVPRLYPPGRGHFSF